MRNLAPEPAIPTNTIERIKTNQRRFTTNSAKLPIHEYFAFVTTSLSFRGFVLVTNAFPYLGQASLNICFITDSSMSVTSRNSNTFLFRKSENRSIGRKKDGTFIPFSDTTNFVLLCQSTFLAFSAIFCRRRINSSCSLSSRALIMV